MLKPDQDDPLKIRRTLAFISCVYAVLVWPNLLIAFHLLFKLDTGVIGNMLMYVGTLVTGPIGAYIWAANKQDNP